MRETLRSLGRCLRLVGDEGATLYLINKDGGDYRPLPVGKPYTWPVQGHQCWIGTTGDTANLGPTKGFFNLTRPETVD